MAGSDEVESPTEGDGGSGGDSRLVAPPDARDLLDVPADVWARLLGHVRDGLASLEDDLLTPAIRRLRSAPVSRLAGGRMRRQLADLLAGGGPPWVVTLLRVREDPELVEALPWLVAGERAGPEAPPPPARETVVDREAQSRLRSRLKDMREQRDDLQRRLDGALGRIGALEAEVERLQAELEETRATVDEQKQALAEAESERDRAVDRERRRTEAEIGELREELRDLRRREQQRREERRRKEERRRQRQTNTPAGDRAQDVTDDVGVGEEDVHGVVHGRPSRLPPEVHPETAEAVNLLLAPGRLVLVDGYNVTKQHAANLDLEGQRNWLVNLLATLVARRRIEVRVVFDGEGDGGGTVTRDVKVSFTGGDLTADDELDFLVAALEPDQPVLVVTDDRELRARVQGSGADVVGTGPFVGAAR